MSSKYHRNSSSTADSPIKTTVRAKSKGSDIVASMSEESPSVTTLSVLFAHFVWFFVGPAAILFTLFKIVNAGTGWVTALDAVFFAIVGFIVLCRWYDQRSGRGTTIYGGPSSWSDFRRYAVVMPAVAFLAWVVANVMGNHLLSM
jgi:hypothetical protein